MKLFILADMEGACGIAEDPEDVSGIAMAKDLNAIIDGASEGGATEIVVRDFHNTGRNIPPEMLDPRATLIRGSAIPEGGIEFDSSFDLIFLTGLHATSGDPEGIAAHTFDVGYRVFLNGTEMGEGEIIAALAGSEGIGVGLVSGDQRFIDCFHKHLPSVRAVATKRALSSSSAVCPSPSRVREELRIAARDAALSAESSPKLRIDTPFHLEVELPTTQHALVATWIPLVERTGASRVQFTSSDLRQVYRLIFLLVGLGSIVADWK